MKGKVVVATDKEGKEYRYPSILSATEELNLSMTTIKLRAISGKPIETNLGEVVLRFEK